MIDLLGGPADAHREVETREMTDADATPGRQPPDPEDLLITCHACGQLRPLMDFREEDLDGGEPWCAGCREIAEELARDEEARRR